MLLNAALTFVYVLIGSFRSSLVYKGQSMDMTEYSTYFITVIGVFEPRFRPDSRESGSTLASYHTSNVTLIIFCCISLLIVGRSSVEHLVNIVAIVADIGGALLDYSSSWWRRITQENDA